MSSTTIESVIGAVLVALSSGLGVDYLRRKYAKQDRDEEGSSRVQLAEFSDRRVMSRELREDIRLLKEQLAAVEAECDRYRCKFWEEFEERQRLASSYEATMQAIGVLRSRVSELEALLIAKG